MTKQLYAVLNNGGYGGAPNPWSMIQFIPYQEEMNKKDLLRAWFELVTGESLDNEDNHREVFTGKHPWWDHQLRELKGVWLVEEPTKKCVEAAGFCVGNDRAMNAMTATLLFMCDGMAVRRIKYD